MGVDELSTNLYFFSFHLLRGVNSGVDVTRALYIFYKLGNKRRQINEKVVRLPE